MSLNPETPRPVVDPASGDQGEVVTLGAVQGLAAQVVEPQAPSQATGGAADWSLLSLAAAAVAMAVWRLVRGRH